MVESIVTFGDSPAIYTTGVSMRMLIDLSVALFGELKALAADRVTPKALILRAVKNELVRARARAPRGRLHFPILDSEEQGSLNLSSRDIEDLLT
jgi:hypothetical protein